MSCRAIAGIAVTIPSCYYILTSIDAGSHGHDDHEEGHGEKHGEEHEEEEKEEAEEEKPVESEEKSEDSDDSESGEEKEADTPETSDDEEDDESEGKNTKKHIPDAKGGAKKRIDSNNSKTLGEKPESDHEDAPADKVCLIEADSGTLFDEYRLLPRNRLVVTTPRVESKKVSPTLIPSTPPILEVAQRRARKPTVNLRQLNLREPWIQKGQRYDSGPFSNL
jgi:hypothetical protein